MWPICIVIDLDLCTFLRLQKKDEKNIIQVRGGNKMQKTKTVYRLEEEQI